jgi:hypothetical protein
LDTGWLWCILVANIYTQTPSHMATQYQQLTMPRNDLKTLNPMLRIITLL